MEPEEKNRPLGDSLYFIGIKIRSDQEYEKGRQWCVLRPSVMSWRFLHNQSDDRYRVTRHVPQRKTAIYFQSSTIILRDTQRIVWTLMAYWLLERQKSFRTAKINVLGVTEHQNLLASPGCNSLLSLSISRYTEVLDIQILCGRTGIWLDTRQSSLLLLHWD
jgi:hypothetical protein